MKSADPRSTFRLTARLLALAAVAAAILDLPGLPERRPRFRIYVVDASTSVGAADGERGAVPTADLALDLIRRDAPAQDRFAVIAAGDVPVVHNEVPRTLAPHARSDVRRALETALAMGATDVVLFSDGRFADATDLVRERGVPVSTMPLGAADPDDARIVDVVHPPVADGPVEVRVVVASTRDVEGEMRPVGRVKLSRGARHEFAFTAGPGEHEIVLDVPDAVPGNNTWRFRIGRSDAKPRVLVYSGFGPASPAAAILDGEVGGGPPDAFDAVVVEELEYAPRGLVEYVRDGGTLLLLGGGRAFALGGYAGTPLDEILPVRSHPTEAAAVAIAIDRSGSMAQGDKMRIAREQVLAAARYLGPDDRLVVIGFSDTADVLYGPGPPGGLAGALQSVRPGGPTHVAAAARRAAEALAKTGLTRKIAVIVTDGDTQEEPADIAAAFAGLEPTVLLTADGGKIDGIRADLGDVAGALRDVFMRERELAIDGPPRMNRTDARDEGVVIAEVRGSPLIATRRVGAGKTGVYTSALTDEWGGSAADLLRLWSALDPKPAGVPVEIRWTDEGTRIAWKVGGAPGDAVRYPGGRATLRLRAPDVVEATVPHGRFTVVGPSRVEVEPPYDPELRAVGLDEAPLRALAAASGGTFGGPWAAPEATRASSGRLLYAALALACFILDAVLRVVWK